MNPDIEEQKMNIGQVPNPWAYNGSRVMDMPTYRDHREQDLRGLMDAFPDPRIQKFLQRRLDDHLTNKYGFVPQDKIRGMMYYDTPSVGTVLDNANASRAFFNDYQAEQERLAAEEAERQRQLGGGGGNGGGNTMDYVTPFDSNFVPDGYMSIGNFKKQLETPAGNRGIGIKEANAGERPAGAIEMGGPAHESYASGSKWDQARNNYYSGGVDLGAFVRNMFSNTDNTMLDDVELGQSAMSPDEIEANRLNSWSWSYDERNKKRKAREALKKKNPNLRY